MSSIPDFYHADSVRPENSVGYTINRLAHALALELDRRMSAIGLTDAQWKPLLLLRQGTCITAADIARLACHDTGAVTRVLDRLEAKGLVQRIRSESDRRVIKLELTPEGEKISAEVPVILSELLNQMLTGFSAEEFALVSALLKRMLGNIQSISKESPTP